MRSLLLAALFATGCFGFDELPDRCLPFSAPAPGNPLGADEPPRWQAGPALDMPTAGHGVVTVDGTLYVVGGRRANNSSTVVLTLAPGATEWAMGPSLVERRSYGAVVPDGQGGILAIGGRRSNEVLKSVEQLQPGGTWTMAPPLPAERYLLAGGLGSDGPMILGGLDLLNASVKSLLLLGPGATEWTSLGDADSHAHFAVASGPDGKIYVLDSGDQNGSIDAQGSFKRLPALVPNRDGIGAVFGLDERLYVVGGTGGLDDFNVYVPGATDGVDWLPLPPLKVGRTEPGVTLGPDGRIYAIGGTDALAVALTSVEIYGPVLSAEPVEAKPGGNVVLHGSNFAPDAAVAIGSEEGCALANAQTDAAGEFTASIRLPQEARVYTFRAVDGRSRFVVRTSVTVR